MITECKYCAATFSTKNGRRIFCSDKCKVAYNREHNLTCFYCGDLATSRDHVTPHSTTGLKNRAWSGIDYVMCCTECNSILGDNEPYSMVRRIDFLIEKFTKRHKLNKPRVQWDEDELADVSKSMAQSIRAHMRIWNKRQERLDHMRLRRLYVHNEEIETVDKEDHPIDTDD